MKLYCLSGHPTRPCFVLKFKNTTIMLDCGLDMTSALNFLPLPLVHKSPFSIDYSNSDDPSPTAILHPLVFFCNHGIFFQFLWRNTQEVQSREFGRRRYPYFSSRLANLPVYTPRDSNDPHLEGELRECSGRVFVDSTPEFCPPQTGLIDFAEVDIILISNYLCMMALPYITEHMGFRGLVYATEPTLQIGRQFMEEVLHFIERTPRNKLASQWKQPDILKTLPVPLCDAFKPQSWRQWYTTKEMNSSLARVQTVGFLEKRDAFGALTCTPVSSGYCLGSCNWVIQSDHETIAYLSGSSTLTTHPKPMEVSLLRNADIMILCGLSQTSMYNPDAMLGEFCATVATTVRNGGNVLVPCYPSGVIYDLFECLSGHLDNQGLSLIPMYFVSPMADSSLAYSNIYAEWLSQGKQSKVYLPEEPFPHGQLVRCGRLKPFPNLHSEGFNTEFRCPCIMFTGHPSLRFGDVVHFVELWGNSHANTIVFTEPDFPYLDALAPFQPLAMKAVYCPIDTSLNFSQANKQIRDLKLSHLVVPESYMSPPVLYQHRTDLVVEFERKPLTFKRGDILTLPINRKFERMELDPEVASSLIPVEVKSGISIGTVSGVLSIKDNRCILKPLPAEPPVSRKRRRDEPRHPSTYTWGTLDVDDFVQKLAQAGISDAKVEEASTGYIIHLQHEDTIIQVEDKATHIFCNSDEQLRRTLRDILLQCLNKF